MSRDFRPQTTSGERPSREFTAEPAKHRFGSLVWNGTAFAIALALAVAILAVEGTDPDSLRDALRLTGRWSFLVFWLAYAGGAIAALCGSAFGRLAGRGRDLGLAYASAQSVHLGLVVWLFLITLRPPLIGKALVFFVVGMIVTYILALFSVGAMSKVLGSRVWRALRIVGLNYIMFIFALDFVPRAIHGTSDYGIRRLVEYAPFAAMCLAAPILVLAAAAQRRLTLRNMSPAVRRPSIDAARL